MTVRIKKPEVDIRQKLNELEFTQLPYDKIPVGSVVGCYTALSSTVLSTTSSSFQTYTGMNVTFTPKSATNKLIIHAFCAGEVYGSYSDKGIGFAIYQHLPWATNTIYNNNYDIYNSSDGNQRIEKVNLWVTVDTRTTDQTTINMNYRSTNNSSNAYARLNNYGDPSMLTVWEIKQ